MSKNLDEKVHLQFVKREDSIQEVKEKRIQESAKCSSAYRLAKSSGP